MKSAVETLSPTRVRLTVEVPFDELKPAVDAAYRRVAQQVRIRGFRPGKVPPRILDQHVGRGTVLQEAVNDALPRFYGEAVREQNVPVLGHPEVEVTEFADGSQLTFTVDVDVRPEIELPDYAGLPVTVDDADVGDAEADEQLNGLRERFAVLHGVERPVETGDYVTLDLSATADGEEIEDASATGLSYEVGSDSLVPGLDDALVGVSEGESKTLSTELRGGAHPGRAADVTVTVRGVRTKELPELDDDFAQTASEFDTIDELRADVRERLERVRRLEQGLQARDRVLDALLERVDMPIPEHMLGDEIAWRRQSMQQQLEAVGLTKEQYAEAEGKSVEEFDADIEQSSRQAIKAQFVLDAIAQKEELGASEPELTEMIVRRAQRAGMPADQLARQIVEGGQLGSLMSELLRNKALALVLEQARVTDRSGRDVDLEALREQPEQAASAAETDSDTDAAPGDPAQESDTASAEV